MSNESTLPEQPAEPAAAVSRRGFLKLAGASGLATATGGLAATARAAAPADPSRARFDTSHGTIHLTLGGGGTSAPLDVYGENPATGYAQAKVFTKPNRPVPGAAQNTFTRKPADALEDAIWSARRDTGTGYGIAVFDHDPGQPGGTTTITMRYYHAPGADQQPTRQYELFETIELGKQRRGR